MRIRFAVGVCTFAVATTASHAQDHHPGLSGRLLGEEKRCGTPEAMRHRSRFHRLLDTKPKARHGNGAAQRRAREEHRESKRQVIADLLHKVPTMSVRGKALLLDALRQFGGGRG